MKYPDFKKVKNTATALVVIAVMSIIDGKPSIASTLPSSNLYSNFSTRCQKSVPEPHALIGIMAMGILGSSYLLRLRLRMKNKAGYLNDDISLKLNDYSITDHQETQIIPFIEPEEINAENHHQPDSNLELQLVEPK
ncbi:MAG: hypothetical protein EAZ77_14800 [Nostocales cyanobacterium]|nr:MAG: hypothetical protein EAZ77_14800 [Nostocales cyanobacterium]